MNRGEEKGKLIKILQKLKEKEIKKTKEISCWFDETRVSVHIPKHFLLASRAKDEYHAGKKSLIKTIFYISFMYIFWKVENGCTFSFNGKKEEMMK